VRSQWQWLRRSGTINTTRELELLLTIKRSIVLIVVVFTLWRSIVVQRWDSRGITNYTGAIEV